MVYNNKLKDRVHTILTYIVFFVVVVIVILAVYSSLFVSFKEPQNHMSPQFLHKVQLGTEYYKTKTLVICGLMRDCEQNIDSIKEKMDVWCRYFAKIHVIVVENDSQDQTRSKLFQWKKEAEEKGMYQVDILGCGINNESAPCRLPFAKTGVTSFLGGMINSTDISQGRLEKMVYLRNLYLDYIHNHPELKTFDFCSVIDMDLSGDIPIQGMLHSGSIFSDDSNVDAVCGNGWRKSSFRYYYYYDTFAYQTNRHVYFPAFNAFVRAKFTGDHFGISSAFGGCAFYRISSIQSARYATKKVALGYQCEHLDFHSPLKIVLDPTFLFVIVA